MVTSGGDEDVEKGKDLKAVLKVEMLGLGMGEGREK